MTQSTLAHVHGSSPRHDGGHMLKVRLQTCGSAVTASAPIDLPTGSEVLVERVGPFWRLVRQEARTGV